jgi:hypothetical protein
LLKNMVTADEVDADLKSEVTDECGKFGRVLNVEVFIQPNSRVSSFNDPSNVTVSL